MATVIIDQSKFPLDGLLKFSMEAASWLTSQGAEYSVHVDDDVYVYITLDDEQAVNFKLRFSDYMVEQTRIDDARFNHMRSMMQMQRDHADLEKNLNSDLNRVLSQIKAMR